MADLSDRLEQLRQDELNTMLRRLDAEERAEFDEGWSKHVFRLQADRTHDSLEAFLRYVRSWVVTVGLRNDTDWQRQVLESDRVVAEEPVDADGLRSLLGL